MTACRRQDGARLHRRGAAQRDELDALLAACPCQTGVPGARVGGRVCAHVDRLRAEPANQRERLLDHVAAPHDQAGAAGAQRAVEVAQAVAQERDPVRGPAAAGEQPLVEHERRHHLLLLRERGGQGRVVADAQVAGEEEERASHGTPLPAPRRRGRSAGLLGRATVGGRQRRASPGQRVERRSLGRATRGVRAAASRSPARARPDHHLSSWSSSPRRARRPRGARARGRGCAAPPPASTAAGT